MAQDERTNKHSFSLFILLCVCIHICYAVETVASVDGFVVESENGARHNGQTYIIVSDTSTNLRLFGQDFRTTTSVAFTTSNGDRGADCDDVRDSDPFSIIEMTEDFKSALVEINMPIYEERLKFCLKDRSENITGSWTHQGNEDWLSFNVEQKPKRSTMLPLAVQIALIVVLLCCSGLFSGLNLGLMSLDKTELKILRNSGTKREKSYAKIVASVRKRGNYLLCTILLGNVLVNNTLTILLDDLTGSGPIAVIIATAVIVIFGEIVPQAICSRYGLAIGAKTIWFTRIFMVLTFPLSFPISKILDCVLGEEMGNVYNRDRLRELLKESNTDLKKDEMNIITGALELSKKSVVDIMTKIEDVYMLEMTAILDFDTVSEIMKTGYTRVPVYEDDKNNIVNLLNIKDLAFIDPDDGTPLSTVCKFYNHETKMVYHDTELVTMLEMFKKGQYHMAFVRRVNSEGTGDPYYDVIGVVTLEDVIEEIIQSEIMDETDTVTDNRSKARRFNPQSKDFSLLNTGEKDSTYEKLSPQLLLATLQYMSTAVASFNAKVISHAVLHKLLHQNVVFTLHWNAKNTNENCLYKKNRPADYFILILQGRVEVDVGKDGMRFEAGPFTYFGLPAVTGPPSMLSKQQSLSSLSTVSDSLYMPRQQYIPDFDVKATSDLQYLRIRRAHYVAAKRATAMERRGPEDQSTPTDDAFQKEWKRATSINPDDSRSGDDLDVKETQSLKSRSLTTDSIDIELANHSPSSPLVVKKPLDGKDDGAESCTETSIAS